ncbi:MAG: DNA polymerase III subunit gamma/tau [Pseudomonadota bacterium]
MDLGTPPTASDGSGAYRVLARKYRPQHFGALIGQGPMVRTLKNAFDQNRIPQAWMLTGVRGVGKTTTARILARALNYEVDGQPRHPTVDVSAPGIHCQAIMEGRHVDVIEMDAASHTSINDIREITDAARYKPVSALNKVYIIDEVHMLSTAAFNGLLKTLEEPPAHVKFIFATTEIRKVPVTVLSRCQRFDLRRIEADALVAHLAEIAAKETVEADEDALRLLARAAEGSVRDALSLFDQAIAHGAGAVTAQSVRDMLGLADRTRVVDLFEHVMKGDAAAALEELQSQYAVGADPHVVLSDLAAFTHLVTRMKVTGEGVEPGEAEEIRTRSEGFAKGLGLAALSRMWQALLTGLGEVQSAPKPVAAAEMVLIRLCYMTSLPEPDAAAASQPRSGRSASPPSAADAPPAPAEPTAYAQERAPERTARAPQPPRKDQGTPAIASFADLVALVGATSVRLKTAMERDMRLVRFEPGRLEVSLEPGAGPTLANELTRGLADITGERWVVTVSEGSTAPTLREAHQAAQDAAKAEAQDDPLVRALLDQFHDAQIAEVRDAPPAAPDADTPPARSQTKT